MTHVQTLPPTQQLHPCEEYCPRPFSESKKIYKNKKKICLPVVQRLCVSLESGNRNKLVVRTKNLIFI